jgi:protein TonB
MSSVALAHPAAFTRVAASAAPSVGDRRDRYVGFAVAVSLLIHGIALGWLPGLKRATGETPPPPLQIHLSATVAQAAAIAVPPAPTLESRPSTSRREVQPAPPQPQTVLTAAAEETGQEAQTPRAAAASVAVSAEDPRPLAVAPSARPSAPDAGALAAYGRELAGAVATRQRYPRLAQLRQWQGTAVLQLELAAAGGLLAVRVLSSSGHEILDQQALEMVRAAVPLPPLPGVLAGQPLTVDVPVVFKLVS